MIYKYIRTLGNEPLPEKSRLYDISKDIEIAFPGEKFIINCENENVNIVFKNEIDKAILDIEVNKHIADL